MKIDWFSTRKRRATMTRIAKLLICKKLIRGNVVNLRSRFSISIIKIHTRIKKSSYRSILCRISMGGHLMKAMKLWVSLAHNLVSLAEAVDALTWMALLRIVLLTKIRILIISKIYHSKTRWLKLTTQNKLKICIVLNSTCSNFHWQARMARLTS